MLQWLPVVACLALLALLLLWRSPSDAARTSVARVALLYGIRPLWGETAESLKDRSNAASRRPAAESAPRFAWWARAARRIGSSLVRASR
jgi:di/tricarboxylate transporter